VRASTGARGLILLANARSASPAAHKPVAAAIGRPTNPNMPASPTATTDARALALRFVEAFNARDEPALRDLVAEDAELRTLRGGGLRGHDGLGTLLRTAAERDLRLVPLRPPAVEGDGDGVRVTMPIRELIGPDDIERTVELEVRDGRIVAFAVRPFTGS
jgi:hypothetical protein